LALLTLHALPTRANPTSPGSGLASAGLSSLRPHQPPTWPASSVR